MRVVDRQKTITKFALIVILAMGLCIVSCGIAEHQRSTSAPSILCTVDLPQIFQLVILTNVLLVVLLLLVIVPQAPTFALLKPPSVRLFLIDDSLDSDSIRPSGRRVTCHTPKDGRIGL